MSANMPLSAVSQHIDKYLNCPKCKEKLLNPKCLPCSHTLCLDCIEGDVQQYGKTRPLRCHECNEEYAIEADKRDYGLKDNHFIKDVCQLLSRLGLLDTRGTGNGADFRVRCESCQELGANTKNISLAKYKFCLECYKYFCQACIKHHNLYLKEHKSIDIPFKGSVDLLVKMKNKFCERHEGEPLGIYCVTCNVVVCHQCCSAKTGHRDHDTKYIDEAAQEYRTQIKTKVTELKNLEEDSGRSRESLATLKTNVGEDAENNQIMITKRFNELRSYIDKLEKEFRYNVESYKNRETKKIQSQQEKVEIQAKLLENLIGYLKLLSENGSDCAVASSGRDLVARCNRQIVTSEEILSEQIQIPQLEFLTNQSSVEKAFVGDLRIQEKYLMVAYLDRRDMKQKFCRVDLRKSTEVKKVVSLPGYGPQECASCAVDGTMYLIGTGNEYNEMWKWSGETEIKLEGMPFGRRFHSAVHVNGKIYVLGGLMNNGEHALKSIIRYDIETNTWKECGDLLHEVSSFACVAHKNVIYIFGGVDNTNKDANYVQIFNTDEEKVSLAEHAMPSPRKLMKAVLYEGKALIFGNLTCYIYDIEKGYWEERERYMTGLVDFGLTMTTDTLYVVGGGMDELDENGEGVCTDEVKYLPLDHFMSGKTREGWKLLAKLPVPSKVFACSFIEKIKNL